ncbi:MAG: LamG-like jellyroll fold domain-containing protein, partial [Pyrinomonadaceae bacterium]
MSKQKSSRPNVNRLALVAIIGGLLLTFAGAASNAANFSFVDSFRSAIGLREATLTKIDSAGDSPSAGSISLTTLGVASTENFDILSNVAGSTTNVIAINGWEITETGGGARDNEQYAVDTGASNTGDTFSYGAAAATDRALGGLRSGTLIPVFGASFTNSTGSAISSLAVAYTGEQWRLGTASRTDSINFEYSTDATSLSTGTWTPASALNFVTPNTVTTGAKDGNAAANRTALSSTISGLNIPNGGIFWIRWTDTDATSSDDGLSVDDFSLTPNGVAAAPEMDVLGSGNEIVDGDTSPTPTDGTDFGSLDVATGLQQNVFSIANSGNANLILMEPMPLRQPEGGNNYVIITGDTADFSVTNQPTSPIPSGSPSEFAITFNPTTTGLRTATVTISNNDSNENPYNFSIQGTGTAATSTPTNTPTATPTNTPTATPTSTPSGTPTSTPTATPTAAPTATPNPPPGAPQSLYGIQNGFGTPANNRIYQIDRTNGNASNIQAITMPGRTVFRANSLAARPGDGVLFAVLEVSGLLDSPEGLTTRNLVTIDPATGVATNIDILTANIAAISFRDVPMPQMRSSESPDGDVITLYGASDYSGPSTTQRTLFIINQTTAALTSLFQLSNENCGVAIAFAPDDFLYRISGGSCFDAPEGGGVFQKIDVDTQQVEVLTNTIGQEVFALGYSTAAGQMYMNELDGDLYTISLFDGSRTLVGPIDGSESPEGTGLPNRGLAFAAPVGMPTPTPACTPPVGNVLWYRAEANALDSSASTNHGIEEGGVAYAAGKVGQAFSFDGVDDRVVVPVRPVQDDFTIAFWVNTSQMSGSETNWYDGRGLVDGEVSGFANDFGVALGAGKVLFGVGNPDTTIRSGVIANGTWQHVAAIRNRTTGAIQLFINGVSVATGVGGTQSLTAPARLTLGRLQTNISPFNGLIDEVEIFDRQLSQTEIQSIVIAGNGGCAQPTPLADLAIVKTDNVAVVTSPGTTTYTLTVTNA